MSALPASSSRQLQGSARAGTAAAVLVFLVFLVFLATVAACGESDAREKGVGNGAPTAAVAVPEPAEIPTEPPADLPPELHAAWRAARACVPTDAPRWALSADGTYIVFWEPVDGAIPEAEPFAVAIGVARVDGRALAESAVVGFDAEMPHHGHGMNLVPVIERGERNGAFVASGVLLHMPGRWVIAVDVAEDGILERAQWDAEIE